MNLRSPQIAEIHTTTHVSEDVDVLHSCCGCAEASGCVI